MFADIVGSRSRNWTIANKQIKSPRRSGEACGLRRRAVPWATGEWEGVTGTVATIELGDNFTVPPDGEYPAEYFHVAVFGPESDGAVVPGRGVECMPMFANGPSIVHVMLSSSLVMQESSFRP